MKSSLSSLLKKLLPIVTLIILIVTVFSVKTFKPGGGVTIIDDPNVPLANLSTAYFCVAKPGVSLDDIFSLTDDMFDFIGPGTVLYEDDIFNDPDEMLNAVQSVPDFSAFVSEGTTIEWRFLINMEESLVAVGVYTDEIADRMFSSDSLVEVEYYLFNPLVKTSFTNVTPNLCEYIGTGTGYYFEDSYNDPSTLSSLVADVPYYEAPAGKDIEWGSMYEYRGKYIVVGRYISTGASDGIEVAIGSGLDNLGDVILDTIGSEDSEPEEEAAPTQFDSVSSMLAADLEVDSTVYTTGFYSANDGGGASYYITDQKTKTDDMMSFKSDNGLYAILQVENNTLYVDQLGAHGDGIEDDVTYLQKAFDSGYDVKLGKDKRYKLISKGLAIKSNLYLDGNDSHIVADDSYSPTSKDYMKFLIRCAYNNIDTLHITNLNIDVDIQEDLRFSGDSSYFCLLQPRFIKNITLDHTNFYISGGDNKITAFWMDYGCDKLTITNTNFYNYSVGNEGGYIFLCSGSDKYFDYFKDFKDVYVYNCIFDGISGDEAIAIWGPNDVNAVFDTLTIDWRRANSRSTSRAIAISSETGGVNYNVEFYNCKVNVDSPYADSVLGLGSKYVTNLSTYFEGCEFTANVRDTFIHFQLLQKNSSLLAGFDFSNKYNINFENCDITCSKTITGSQKWYNGESIANWGIDSNFKHCTIHCNYAFTYLDRGSSTKYYYIPEINISDCDVYIDNAIGFIYKSNRSAIADINLDDVRVYASNLTTLVSYRYNTNNGGGITQANAGNPETTIIKATLNSKAATK